MLIFPVYEEDAQCRAELIYATNWACALHEVLKYQDIIFISAAPNSIHECVEYEIKDGEYQNLKRKSELNPIPTGKG